MTQFAIGTQTMESIVAVPLRRGVALSDSMTSRVNGDLQWKLTRNASFIKSERHATVLDRSSPYLDNGELFNRLLPGRSDPLTVSAKSDFENLLATRPSIVTL